LGKHALLVVFPMTYMNLSGKAVTAAMAFYKIPPEKVLVLYDDLDIAFGSLRFREKGSAGTHNGMRSIVGDIGPNFPRLRMGIGPKPEGHDTSGFVLGKFTPTERTHLPPLCDATTETVTRWLAEGRDAATRYAAGYAGVKSPVG
jgi:PTH1 family peptidyl-tRNA hydrolase